MFDAKCIRKDRLRWLASYLHGAAEAVEAVEAKLQRDETLYTALQRSRVTKREMTPLLMSLKGVLDWFDVTGRASKRLLSRASAPSSMSERRANERRQIDRKDIFDFISEHLDTDLDEGCRKRAAIKAHEKFSEHGREALEALGGWQAYFLFWENIQFQLHKRHYYGPHPLEELGVRDSDDDDLGEADMLTAEG